MRTLAAVAVLSLALLACGTPCSHIAGAEAQANDKGKSCNAGSVTWSDAKVKSCEQNLSACSENDQKNMETYADCLNKLPVCASGQSISWSLQRLTCGQPLINVSMACASGLN